MGDVIVAAYAVLALVGAALVCFGALRRGLVLLVLGIALLLGLAGAWTLGLPGLAIGVAALAFLRRRNAGVSR